jgi:hypothetical protein
MVEGDEVFTGKGKTDWHAFTAKKLAENAQWQSEWPYRQSLPRTPLPVIDKANLPARIRALCERPVIGKDPVALESIAWATEQGMEFQVQFETIGFKDPDQAFWFKMRWR